MLSVKEAVIVEGKYDKIRLSSLMEGVIIETRGFGIFKDKERMELIRRLAASRGLIVLTDSDGAGFVIRGKLSSCIPQEQIKHAYIPDILGKERRKTQASKEGKLGVEGMSVEILRNALINAGATLQDGEQVSRKNLLTKADLFDLGLAGGNNSGAKRRALQKELGLPERLSANALLQAAGAVYGRDEFIALAKSYFQRQGGEKQWS